MDELDRLKTMITGDRLGAMKQTIKVLESDLLWVFSQYTDAEQLELKVTKTDRGYTFDVRADAADIYEVGKILVE